MYFLFCIKFAVYITKKPNDANGALEPLVFEIQYNPAVVSLLKSEMFLFTATPRNSKYADKLGVKGKLDIVNKGSGSNAFAYDEAQGLMFCIQKDKAKWGLVFVATSGLGSGNVTWNKHDIITGELTFAYNSNGTIAPTNNTYDYAFYYLPIK